jgi:hypothetical protein
MKNIGGLNATKQGTRKITPIPRLPPVFGARILASFLPAPALLH